MTPPRRWSFGSLGSTPRAASGEPEDDSGLVPLLDRVRRRLPGTVAFVLGGGGNLGALQVGMLRALVERGIRPDLVVGCSAGAINGAAFAEDPTPAGVERLADVWAGLQDLDIMPGGWVPSAVQLARKGSSLHDNANLRTLIETSLTARTFEELQIPFECVATDIDCIEERWFGSGDLLAPLLASAAIPALYPIVQIDGTRYMDGGVLNDVPISRAVDAGARTIYVLHVGHYDRDRPDPQRPFDVAVMAYWIVRRRRYLEDLKTLPRGVRAVVLPAGDPPDLRYDDFSRSGQLMEQGYQAALRHLDELPAREDVLAPRRAPPRGPSRHRLEPPD